MLSHFLAKCLDLVITPTTLIFIRVHWPKTGQCYHLHYSCGLEVHCIACQRGRLLGICCPNHRTVHCLCALRRNWKSHWAQNFFVCQPSVQRRDPVNSPPKTVRGYLVGNCRPDLTIGLGVITEMVDQIWIMRRHRMVLQKKPGIQSTPGLILPLKQKMCQWGDSSGKWFIPGRCQPLGFQYHFIVCGNVIITDLGSTLTWLFETIPNGIQRLKGVMKTCASSVMSTYHPCPRPGGSIKVEIFRVREQLVPIVLWMALAQHSHIQVLRSDVKFVCITYFLLISRKKFRNKNIMNDSRKKTCFLETEWLGYTQQEEVVFSVQCGTSLLPCKRERCSRPASFSSLLLTYLDMVNRIYRTGPHCRHWLYKCRDLHTMHLDNIRHKTSQLQLFVSSLECLDEGCQQATVPWYLRRCMLNRDHDRQRSHTKPRSLAEYVCTWDSIPEITKTKHLIDDWLALFLFIFTNLFINKSKFDWCQINKNNRTIEWNRAKNNKTRLPHCNSRNVDRPW